MGSKSTVSRLPVEIKSYIEAMLATGAQTLDELIADLQERWPAEAKAGTLPSRSALHRYGQRLDQKLAAIRASTEAARLITEHAEDSKDNRSEALTALVQSQLFESIMQLTAAMDEETDNEERIKLLSGIAKNIATLNRSSIDLKKFRAEVEEQARQQLLEEQKAKLDELGKTGAVAPEVLEQVIKAAYDL